MEQHRQAKLSKQLRHATWKKENMKYLDDYPVDYLTTNNGNTVMVRTKNVRADFYPTTGRWMECQHPLNIMSGGARSFVAWLKKNGAFAL